jgi:mannosyltransferase OCH1-like enzyme
LHARGGLYADMDTKCVRPVVQMLKHRRATLFIQLYDQLWNRDSKRKINYQQIASSVIACSPAHSIWTLVLAEIKRTPHWRFVTCRTGVYPKNLVAFDF